MTFSSLPKVMYQFSEQEKQIARLVIHGKTTEEMADELCISYNTMRNKMYRMQKSLGAKNRPDFVRILLQEKRRLWDDDIDNPERMEI